MILVVNQRVELVIDGLYQGAAGMTPTGELAFPLSKERRGEVNAILNGKACRLRLDATRFSTKHQFVYARPIDD